MRCSLAITIIAAFSLACISVDASTGNKQRLTHSKHKQRHSGSRYLTRHQPPVIPELPPVMETNMFHSSYDMSYKQTQCRVIPAKFNLCYNIGYTKMHLPNLLGHNSIDELVKQSNEWTPLLRTRCHPEARKFLCSVFAPVCVEDFTDPIPPCRSLCTAVRDSCSPAMARYDYPWPMMLNCSQFPPDDTLCIPSDTISTVATRAPAATVCAPCRRKKINRGFKKKLCSFDFVMKSRVKHVTYQDGNIKLTLEKKSRYVMKWLNNVNSKAAKKVMAKKNIVWMKDGLNCTCDVLQDGARANYLMAGWHDNGKLRLYSITKWRKSDKRLGKLLRRKRCSVTKSKNKRSEA